MIEGILTLIAATLFAISCVYLDYKWVKRIMPMFEDQKMARQICDARLERDESSRILTWSDLRIRPKSKYYWRLKFVEICADSHMAHVEAAGLAGIAIVQGLIAFGIGAVGLALIEVNS